MICHSMSRMGRTGRLAPRQISWRSPAVPTNAGSRGGAHTPASRLALKPGAQHSLLSLWLLSIQPLAYLFLTSLYTPLFLLPCSCLSISISRLSQQHPSSSPPNSPGVWLLSSPI